MHAHSREIDCPGSQPLGGGCVTSDSLQCCLGAAADDSTACVAVLEGGGDLLSILGTYGLVPSVSIAWLGYSLMYLPKYLVEDSLLKGEVTEEDLTEKHAHTRIESKPLWKVFSCLISHC